jgi:hypothetical protein
MLGESSIYIEKHKVGLMNQAPTKADKIWV